LIFGNYLLDFKTDKRCYILDITDVESWSLTEDVGKRTLDVVRFKVGGTFSFTGIPNEAVLDENNFFHSFIWNSPSGAIRYQIPGYSFFAPPTTQTIGANVTGFDVDFAGYVLNDNGSDVIAVGFEYGDNDDPSTWTESTPGTGDPAFTGGLTGLLPGVYYYRAFAENGEGIGYGEVLTFEIEAPPATPTPTPTPTAPPTTQTIGANVTGFDVDFSGYVLNDNGSSVIAVGFEYGDNDDPLTWTESTPGTGDPAFTGGLTGLLPGVYYYRAFAENSEGIGYGEVLVFEIETPPPPTPTPTPTPPEPTPTPPLPTPSATPTPPLPTPSATPTPTPPLPTPPATPTPTPPLPTPSATPTPTPPPATPTPTPPATPTPTPTPPAPTPTPPPVTPTPTPPAPTPTPPATPTPTPPEPTPTPPEPTPTPASGWVYVPTIYLGSIPIAGKFIQQS
jgi:hypothetical protein